MIRTEDKTPLWVYEQAATLIKSGNEELGVRAIKAEALAPIAKMHINNKPKFRDVIDDRAPWGKGVVARVLEHTEMDVRVAYADEYVEWHRYDIDNILYGKSYEDIGSVRINFRDYSYDRGPADKRYHMFQVADIEVLLMGDATICMFRDLHTGRDFIAKAEVAKI